MIFTDRASDSVLSADGSQVRHIANRLRFDIRKSLMPGLVRSMAVVVNQVLAEEHHQVAFAEYQHPAQNLAAQNSDDALADSVHAWRHRQGGDRPQPVGFEHLPERGGEQRITNRKSPMRSPKSMTRFRACRTAHAPVGYAVTPPR